MFFTTEYAEGSIMRNSLDVDSKLIPNSVGMQEYQLNTLHLSHLCKSFFLNTSIDAKKIKVKKGDSIFNNGDDHEYLYIIRIGFIKIENCLPNGQYQITQFGIPGDLLGLDGIANGKHRLAAYALNDGEIYAISVKKLHAAMNMDHSLLMTITQLLSSALNHTQQHIFSLSMHTAEKKLAFFLIDFRNALDGLCMRTDTITLPMNREELRSYLGMTLETLSRCFTFLERKGYILVRNRDITFLEPEKLEQFLEIRE